MLSGPTHSPAENIRASVFSSVFDCEPNSTDRVDRDGTCSVLLVIESVPMRRDDRQSSLGTSSPLDRPIVSVLLVITMLAAGLLAACCIVFSFG